MYRNLMAEMIRNDIDKDQIAKQIGKTARTLDLKLNGTTDFTVPEAKAIIQLFDGYSFDYLFEEKNNPDHKQAQ